MTDRSGARLAWGVFTFVAISFAVSSVLLMTQPPAASDWGMEGHAAQLLFTGTIFAFPMLGALVAARQPRNAVGWILLGVGLVWGVTALLQTYYVYALDIRRGSLPRPDVALAVASSLWVPGVGLIGTFLILLFPDGRLPSRRWRPFAWACGVVLTLVTLLILVKPGNFGDFGYPDIKNPLELELLRGFGLVSAAPVLVASCVVGAAAALIGRFHRSRGQQRLQLKWLAAGTTVVALLALVAVLVTYPVQVAGSDAPSWAPYVQQVSLVSLILIPLAVGIAVLRHRLYDIDVIINRTLVYGALTAILGAAYALIVTVAGTILQGSEIVTAGGTLAVAALFQPLRRRIQGFIDRRFYRRKYDAVRTVEAFSSRLRNEVDLEAMRADLLAAVHETMQPRRVSLWLKG